MYLKRSLSLNSGSAWTFSIAIDMALALVSPLKSSKVPFQGVRSPILNSIGPSVPPFAPRMTSGYTPITPTMKENNNIAKATRMRT